MARPTKYTNKLGLEICARIAEGESVRSICRDHKEFSDQYERSRAAKADNLFEEMLEIADDGTNDFTEKEIAEGVKVEQYNGEHVHRSRLRLDTRKWALSKMLPKRFGDKQEVKHTGAVDINPAATFLEALRQGREGKK